MAVRFDPILSDAEVLYDVDLDSSMSDSIVEALQDQKAISSVYQRIAASAWFKNFESHYDGIGIPNAVLNKINPDNEVEIQLLCSRVDAVANMVLNPNAGGEEPTEILQGVAALKKTEQNSLIKRAIKNTDLTGLHNHAFEDAFFKLAKEQLEFERSLEKFSPAVREALRSKIAFALDEEEDVLDLRIVLVEKISNILKLSNSSDKDQIERYIIASIQSAEDLEEVNTNLEKLSGEFCFVVGFILSSLNSLIFEVLSFFVTIISLFDESPSMRAVCPISVDPSFLRKI